MPRACAGSCRPSSSPCWSRLRRRASPQPRTVASRPCSPESPNASHTQTAYYVILGFTSAIFVLVEGLLVVFIVKYRRRGRSREVEGAQVHGHTRLELIWTVIPVVILCVIGVVVFLELPNIDSAPGFHRPDPHHGRGPPVLLAVRLRRLPEPRPLDRDNARPRRPGRRPQGRLARRHPQLVGAGARRQDPGDPGTRQPLLVQGEQGGQLRRPVRRALRRLPRVDARRRAGRVAAVVPALRLEVRPGDDRRSRSGTASARPATATSGRAATGRRSRATRSSRRWRGST